MLVPKSANCQYRYGAAHYQYWFQFWHRLSHILKFPSSHLSYFVNFILATLLCSIYRTLSIPNLLHIVPFPFPPPASSPFSQRRCNPHPATSDAPTRRSRPLWPAYSSPTLLIPCSIVGCRRLKPLPTCVVPCVVPPPPLSLSLYCQPPTTV